jgi:hypothetical protein
MLAKVLGIGVNPAHEVGNSLRSAACHVMRRIPDMIIFAGVIGGAIALATGFRWLGCACFILAVIVGWKRNWCGAKLEELVLSLKGPAGDAHDAGALDDGSSGTVEEGDD